MEEYHTLSLAGPRVVLRPFRPADASALAAAIRDPEVMRFSDLPCALYEAGGVDAYVRSLPELAASGRTIDLAVTTSDDLAGHVAFYARHDPAEAVLGCWVTSRWRRCGLASDAIRAAAELGRTRLGLAALVGDIHVVNLAARALVEKLGFRDEGPPPPDEPYAAVLRTPNVPLLRYRLPL